MSNMLLNFFYSCLGIDWCSTTLNWHSLQKIGSSGRQNATRCGLWWVEMLKARDQHKDAAVVYFRICDEVMHNLIWNEIKRDPVFAHNIFLFLGTFTFGCNAWASVLLLFVIQTSHVTQVWISSCSFWWSVQKKWSGIYVIKFI